MTTFSIYFFINQKELLSCQNYQPVGRYNLIPYCRNICLFDNVFVCQYIKMLSLQAEICNKKMEIVLKQKIKEAVQILYNSEVADDLIQIQETRKEFKGDFTLVVFPLIRFSRNTPEKTGETIGSYLLHNFSAVVGFNVIKSLLF